MSCRLIAGILGAAFVRAGVTSASPIEFAPPGPYVSLTAEDHQDAPGFKRGQPVVATTFFYWYDIYTMQHFRDGDGTDALTRHPPESEIPDYSYRSTSWHARQLTDMSAAGIDVVLPVYWGVPGEYDGWSFVGIKHLVEAHDALSREASGDEARRMPPQIGLFYDTSTLTYYGQAPQRRREPWDLTSPEGREWFFVTIRDFFSLVPPSKWARIDGRPIIFLYGANFASKVDDTLFEDTRQRFRQVFGVDCFLVKNHDWPGAADAVTIWGGATGLKIGRHVAALGPGYDHSAVPGRQPLVVEREDGSFYRRQWEKLLRMNPATRPWIVHVETWNEWHEGTDVARSLESGDLYLRLTGEFTELFHRGVRLERSGPFVNAANLSWSAERSDGITQRESGGDGCWEMRNVDGAQAIATAVCPDATAAKYLYFNVDDSYLFDAEAVVVEVQVSVYGDGGCDAFRLEYDSALNTAGPREGAFRPTESVALPADGTWHTFTFFLPEVRFTGRTNSADLRIAPLAGRQDITMRAMTVRKLPGRMLPVAGGTTRAGP